jgi:hypothetical protein
VTRTPRIVHTTLLVAYLVLPSLVWTLVYRDPKIVADVLLLLVLEGLSPGWMARTIRLGWCLLCGSMLLLEWNIFPESYAFYFGLMIRAASFPQGRAVVIGFLLLVAFMALPPPRRTRRRTTVALLALYAALTVLKLAPQSKPYVVWLRQPALRALQVAWTDLPRLASSSVAPPAYDALTPGHVRLRSWIDEGDRAPDKVMILLLESWGQAPATFRRLVERMGSASGASLVESGYTPYAGPTLAGEVRELCGRVLSFRSIDASLSDCLPKRSRERGYVATAFHGYEAYFYNRQIIYPQIGFSKSFFAPDLDGLDRCGGAFDGICDDAVLARALGQLGRPGRQFVYMMSLSAHEPVSPDMALRPYIRRIPGPLDGPRVNAALIRLAVLQMARRDRDGDRVLYIVGDHNPPGGEEAQALPPGKVPYILFRWRPGSDRPRGLR